MTVAAQAPGIPTARSERLRRGARRVFLASIAVNATLGIWVLLSDDFGETEGKILATSLLVSAAMLSVLVNAAPLRRHTLWPVPAVAISSAVASFALFIVLMWAEVEQQEALKTAVSGLIIAAGATVAGLVSLLSLRPSQEFVRRAHGAVVAILTATALWGLWAEIDSSWYGRVVGVQSVLVAALTLAVPVLSRFGDSDDRDDRAISVPPELAVRDLVDRFIAADVTSAVVDGPDGPVGLVSEHDIVRAIGSGAELETLRVADVMSPLSPSS